MENEGKEGETRVEVKGERKGERGKEGRERKNAE